MYYVTVDPETGNDCITWYSSPSPEVDYYTIATRLVTMPGEPDSFLPVGTIPVPDTTWCNTSLESSGHSVGYAVWGVDDRGGGQTFIGAPSRTDSTMFLHAVLDSCNGTITLNWNDYNSWRGGQILNYNVYRWLSAGVYLLISAVDTNSFVISNVQINQNYDLFVEAVNTDGIRRSTSNRVSVFTQISQQPGYINADYATISAENTIDLSFTVDGTSSLDRYKLQRSSDQGGSYTTIDTIVNSGTNITYTDDIPFSSGVYYYRLEVMNNCGSSSGQSNLANNIILNGTLSGNTVSLQWNEYVDWAGGVENYRIIRTLGRTNPVTDTLSTGITGYTDDISGLINNNDPSSSFVCYQIDAIERLNVYGIKGKSLSNRMCFSVTPEIRMPNAFIPNDNEPVNQILEPVFSFTPESYQLIIYNRLGTKLWEGKGPWNGKVAGQYVPEGVYLYLLRVYNYSTDIIELNGKVTVVYR
jgi:hypothetical protein